MKLAPRLLLSLLPLLIACEKKAPSDEVAYGEPVGVTMQASKDLPGFEVAIAVTKGVAIDPLVPPLGGLLHKALRACPDFVKAAAASPEAATQIAFTIEQGKTKGATSTVKGADCVTSSLNAQDLPNLTITPEATAAPAPAQSAPGPAQGKLHVVAMLRFPSAPGSGAEGRKP